LGLLTTPASGTLAVGEMASFSIVAGCTEKKGKISYSGDINSDSDHHEKIFDRRKFFLGCHEIKKFVDKQFRSRKFSRAARNK